MWKEAAWGSSSNSGAGHEAAVELRTADHGSAATVMMEHSAATTTNTV